MTEARKAVQQTNREDCYFCGSDGPIETHHIVPDRYEGSDANQNLVDLCPTCHERLERLYDKDFYKQLNAHRGANKGYSDAISDVHAAFNIDLNELTDDVDPETKHKVYQSIRDRVLANVAEEMSFVYNYCDDCLKVVQGNDCETCGKVVV